MGNAAKGMAHGVLGLFGAGSAYDPLGEARADLAKVQSDQQAMINTNTLTELKIIQTTLQTEAILDEQNKNILEKTIELNNDALSNSLFQVNMFTIFLFVLIFFILMYILI